MLTYTQLDSIADAFIPALGVVWIVSVGFRALRGPRQIAVANSALGLACVFIAYGLMWLDGALSLWAAVGLDYSTHTAVAVALAFAIAVPFSATRIPLGILVMAYFGLMLYQRYHTVSDIVSTLIVVGMLMMVVVLRYRSAMTVQQALSADSLPPSAIEDPNV